MKLLLLLLALLGPLPQTDFYGELADAALSLTEDNVIYDGSYFKMKYPMGDVPKNKGVCTDVVIRAYRKVGIDLQKEVHEDMAVHFSKYPQSWGLKTTDTNIDHRRVPNLQVFFGRKGQALPITSVAADYRPGDIVTWMLAGNLPHIGMVSQKVGRYGRYLIVHNIGNGQKSDDCLFDYKIKGHYRYKK
jgi:uncharacterized protein YijF (DUF1287 family)